MKRRAAQSSTNPSKLHSARIKKIMQTNPDIPKIQHKTPEYIAKATELFVRELTRLAAAEAENRSNNKILPTHVREAVDSKPEFDMIK